MAGGMIPKPFFGGYFSEQQSQVVSTPLSIVLLCFTSQVFMCPSPKGKYAGYDSVG